MERTILTKEVLNWINYELSTSLSKRLRKDLEEAKKVWSSNKTLQKRYNSTHKTPLNLTKTPYNTKN
jgi:hypothetical protein